MSMNFPGFLRLVLPTFFLMSAFVGRGMFNESRHRQLFGDRDYFLELRFDASPALRHIGQLPYVRFEGELVSDKESRPVSGFLSSRGGKPSYHLRVGGEVWNGVLKALPESCDGFLELTELRTGRPVAPSRLKAGFCATTS